MLEKLTKCSVRFRYKMVLILCVLSSIYNAVPEKTFEPGSKRTKHDKHTAKSIFSVVIKKTVSVRPVKLT